MKKKLVSLLVAASLLCGLTGTVYAGIEPSPFQPQINKLNSIQLSMAFVQKSLGNVVVSKSVPFGTRGVLLGIKYNLTSLDKQLTSVLAELPPYSQLGEWQNGVYYALEGLRINALSMADPFDYILWRLGVGPSPFKDILDSMSSRITAYSRGSYPSGN